MHNAIKAAVAKGIVVVVSSGNEYSNVPHYPGSLPEVISVGATDSNGVAGRRSAPGATTVDIAAPGWKIMSAYPRRF